MSIDDVLLFLAYCDQKEIHMLSFWHTFEYVYQTYLWESGVEGPKDKSNLRSSEWGDSFERENCFCRCSSLAAYINALCYPSLTRPIE